MRRLQKLDRAALDEAQRSLYDTIVSGPRGQGRQAFSLVDGGGGLEGPFNAMLLSPSVGEALQGLGAAIRYRSSLPDRAREMAILIVAQRWASDFEWFAHSAIGRLVGLEDDDLEALRDGGIPPSADNLEQTVVHTTHALLDDGDLDDGAFTDASAGLGSAALFDLTTLVGYYATVARQLRVYRVPLPDGAAPVESTAADEEAEPAEGRSVR